MPQPENLTKLVLLDLITVGRLPMVLLLCLFLSAMSVVFVTHHSRQLITEKDQLLDARERLDDEWRNLILEETALSEHSRVQDAAQKELGMRRPDTDREVLIEQP